jgi:5'-3' exonuclease
VRNAAAVQEKFGVPPERIPDYLALVGDSADGYPGISGIGARTAARLVSRHGPLEQFPADVLGERRAQALLFKALATLKCDAPLFREVDELRWRGPTATFPAVAERMGAHRVLARCRRVASSSGT